MKSTPTLLRYIRRNRELRLLDVSRQTGVNVSLISKIERGLMTPSAPQANALAGYFGKPIHELLANVPESEIP